MYADGSQQLGQYASFSPGSHDWEYASTTIPIVKPVSKIVAYVFFQKTHTGTAWFDSIELREATGAPEASPSPETTPSPSPSDVVSAPIAPLPTDVAQWTVVGKGCVADASMYCQMCCVVIPSDRF